LLATKVLKSNCVPYAICLAQVNSSIDLIHDCCLEPRIQTTLRTV